MALGISLERLVGPWRLLLVWTWGCLLASGAALAFAPMHLVTAGAGPVLGLAVAEMLERRRVSGELLPWLILLGLLGWQGQFPLASLAGLLAGAMPVGRLPVAPGKVAGALLLASQLVTLVAAWQHPSATSYPPKRFEDPHFAFQYPGIMRPVGPLLVGPGFTLEVGSSDSGRDVDIAAQMAHLAKRFSETGQSMRTQKPDEWSLGGRNWMSLGGTYASVYSRVAFAKAGTRVYRVTLSSGPEDAAQAEAVLRQVLLSFEMPGAPAPVAAPGLTSEDLVRQGMASLSARDFKGAEVLFSQALEKDPHSSDALLSRALARLALKDLDGALEDVQGPVRANPMDYRGLLLRAKILGQKKEFDSSLADLGKVLELVSGQPPVEATALRERAEVLQAQGHTSAAIADLERAVALQPENAELSARLDALRKAR